MLENYKTFEIAIAKLLDAELEDLAGYTDSLLDFGLDSVQIMSFIGQLEKLGISVSFIELAANVELKAWWTLIDNKQEEKVAG